MGSQWVLEPSVLPGNSGRGRGGRADEPGTADAALTTKQRERAHQKREKKAKKMKKKRKNHLRRQTSMVGAPLSPHVPAPCGGMCFSLPRVTHLAFSRDLQEAPCTHIPVLSTSHKNNQPR